MRWPTLGQPVLAGARFSLHAACRTPGSLTHISRFQCFELSSTLIFNLFTLNSHPAYETLRNIRAGRRKRGELFDGHAMAVGPTAYSATRNDYVRTIRQLIRRFDLAGFDNTGQDST